MRSTLFACTAFIHAASAARMACSSDNRVSDICWPKHGRPIKIAERISFDEYCLVMKNLLIIESLAESSSVTVVVSESCPLRSAGQLGLYRKRDFTKWRSLRAATPRGFVYRDKSFPCGK